MVQRCVQSARTKQLLSGKDLPYLWEDNWGYKGLQTVSVTRAWERFARFLNLFSCPKRQRKNVVRVHPDRNAASKVGRVVGYVFCQGG